MEDLQDLPLPVLFARAEASLKALEGVPPGPEGEARAVTTAEAGAAAARQAAALVDSLGLFSANEEADDIATSDLKYLLLPYLRGELAAASRAREPAARAAALSTTAQHYRAFLHTLQLYGLLKTEAAAMLEALKGASDDDAPASSSRGSSANTLVRRQAGGARPPGGPVRGVDPATLRAQKIAKFKREKYLAARLAALKEMAQLAGQAGCSNGTEEADEAGGDAEERERERWLLQLEQAALRSADALGSLQQEIELLRHAASLPQDPRQRAEQRQAEQQGGPPPAMLAKLREAAGVLQAGSSLGQREQLRQEVLRPSHILPTMTVEQWGDVEVRMAMERQQKEAAAAAAEAARRAADPAAAEEEDLQKQRAWDDWLDDNPRGWGNSKLRPCG